MAEVVWTLGALHDLDAIADYVALDNADAAKRLVQKVFAHVEALSSHPNLGSFPKELGRGRYRQIVEPPCRVLYRIEGSRVLILHVMRAEQRLRPTRLRIRHGS